jgi:hypothetical protein
MKIRAQLLLATSLIAACASQSNAPAPAPAPIAAPTPTIPERAVRRTIPITNMIRRAYTAGTRDSTGAPGRNYWQLTVDYDIDARLDVPTSTLSGREKIVLHNNSPESLSSIILRLDQNLYAPQALRARDVPEITDGMKITRITLNGAPVALTAPAGQSPNMAVTAPTASGLRSTVARIALPSGSSIQPKTTATLEIDWSFRVPLAQGERGLRMGRWADSLFQIAQWYPRVAVYDDLRGWDTEPYLGASEFYNNFGRFNVRVDVPSGWLVGATGVLQNPEQVLTPTMRERLARALTTDSVVQVVTASERRINAGNGRSVWHFVADTVNDFAWATSNRYVWDATRANIPTRGYIPVHVFYPPANYSNGANFQRVPQSTRHALEFYSKLWMPYAFPQLTVADGPDRGMEYPMFIMSALGAADHEAGHQWWPMMVSNNETWYGFMDEGFNQYMNILSAADARGQPANLNGHGQNYGRISGNEYEAPQMYNANYGGPMYGFQAYSKAPMMLSMLGGVVGDSAVWRAQSEFAKTWRFKHPTPWDYAFSMNRSLKRDLGWFWYYWLHTTESSNGSIQSVTTSGARTTVTVRQTGEMPAPVVLKVDFADNTSETYTFPVEVWFPGSRTFDAVIDTGAKIVTKVTYDPNQRFPDRDATDNTWTKPST